MAERVEGGWEDRGWKKEVEMEVRRGGKRERRIAGGGTLVGGWGFVGSGGGDLGVGIEKGRFGGFVVDVGLVSASQDVKSSHGSSSLANVSNIGFGAEGVRGDFCELPRCTKFNPFFLIACSLEPLSICRVAETVSIGFGVSPRSNSGPKASFWGL